MILSHQHRFVFIKGLKVAGTSAEIALSQICGPDDIVTPISPVDERYRLGTAGTPRNYSRDAAAERDYMRAVADEPIETIRLPKSEYYNHMSYAEVLEKLPEADGYALLFIERSPYEKVISYANWSRNRRDYDAGRSLPSDVSGLEQAVQELIASGEVLQVRNIDRYRDSERRIRSAGWRFDRLAESMAYYFRQLGLAPVPLVHAKRGTESRADEIRKLLSPATIAYIDGAFADEFEAFGFARVRPASN